MADDMKIACDYEQDFFEWSQEQAERLRVAGEVLGRTPLRPNDLPGILKELDWKNLAEEIESLGRRDRRELFSRISTVIEHLIKLEFSAAVGPRQGWRQTITRERIEIEQILQDSPSLRRSVADHIEKISARAVKLAVTSLKDHEEVSEAVIARLRGADGVWYSAEQILSDWWPAPPDGEGAP
jgi:hypothetical protein